LKITSNARDHKSNVLTVMPASQQVMMCVMCYTIDRVKESLNEIYIMSGKYVICTCIWRENIAKS